MLDRLNDLLKKYPAACSWLLILTVTVAYRGSLSFGFVYDDIHVILDNPFIKNPHFWKQIFLGGLLSFEGPQAHTGYYRPLTIFSYWLICRVDGFNPAAYHFVLVALYTLSVWMVYSIGRRILGNELAAVAGALLWALHPLHVEVAAWISSLSDIGCTLFCLLAFRLFLRAEDHSRLRGHVASAAVYLPALFFKEVAFCLPLLLLVYWLCQPSGLAWRRRAVNGLPYLAAAAICVAIRRAVMGGFSEISVFPGLGFRVPVAAIALLGQHLKLFFWPVNLSEFRDFDLMAGLRSPWPWIVLLIIASAGAYRRARPRLSLCVLWWVAALLPCVNYRQLTLPVVADRFSYLASVGLCLAIGYLAFVELPKQFPNQGCAWLAGGSVVLLAVLWAVQTMRTLPHWRNNDTLFEYSLQASPRAAQLHAAHGVVLQLRDNDLEGAAREFRTALRLNAQDLQPLAPVDYGAYIGLGQIALHQGREAEGLSYLEKAAHLLPRSGFAYEVLGAVYFPRGDYARAANYFRQAVSANPMDTNARFYLGTCLLKLAQPAPAAEQFHAAREVDPAYSQAYLAEAASLEAAGDKAGAARVRREMPSVRADHGQKR